MPKAFIQAERGETAALGGRHGARLLLLQLVTPWPGRSHFRALGCGILVGETSEEDVIANIPGQDSSVPWPLCSVSPQLAWKPVKSRQ